MSTVGSLSRLESFSLTEKLASALDSMNKSTSHPILGGLAARGFGVLATPCTLAIDIIVHCCLIIVKTATGVIVTPYNLVARRLAPNWTAPEDLTLGSAVIHVGRFTEHTVKVAIIPWLIFFSPSAAKTVACFPLGAEPVEEKKESPFLIDPGVKNSNRPIAFESKPDENKPEKKEEPEKQDPSSLNDQLESPPPPPPPPTAEALKNASKAFAAQMLSREEASQNLAQIEANITFERMELLAQIKNRTFELKSTKSVEEELKILRERHDRYLKPILKNTVPQIRAIKRLKDQLEAYVDELEKMKTSGTLQLSEDFERDSNPLDTSLIDKIDCPDNIKDPLRFITIRLEYYKKVLEEIDPIYEKLKNNRIISRRASTSALEKKHLEEEEQQNQLELDRGKFIQNLYELKQAIPNETNRSAMNKWRNYLNEKKWKEEEVSREFQKLIQTAETTQDRKFLNCISNEQYWELDKLIKENPLYSSAAITILDAPSDEHGIKSPQQAFLSSLEKLERSIPKTAVKSGRWGIFCSSERRDIPKEIEALKEEARKSQDPNFFNLTSTNDKYKRILAFINEFETKGLR